MTKEEASVAQCLENLRELIAKEEEYCLPNAEQHARCLKLMKELFDQIVKSCRRPFGSLESLIVDGFDIETIWEELQTRNKPFLKAFQKKYNRWKKISQEASKKKQRPQDEFTGTDQESDSDQDAYNLENGYEQNFDDNSEDMDEGEEEDHQEDEAENISEEEDEDEVRMSEGDESDREDSNDEPVAKANVDRKNKKSSIYEEELKMEAWLDAFEEMENKHRDKVERLEKKAQKSKMITKQGEQWSDEEDNDEGDDDDDLEFVQNAFYNTDEGEDDDEEDEADEDDIDPSKIRYEDFFMDEEEKKKKSFHSRQSRNKTQKGMGKEEDDDNEDDEEDRDDYDEGEEGFENEDEEEGSDEDQDHDDYEEEDDQKRNKNSGNSSKFLSNYERRQLELQQQIEELEKELLAEKSWEYKGEIKASQRPENSLLDALVDVERSTKVAPIVTQEFTNSLEEMIIKRIKEQKFDDPNPYQRRNINEMKITDPAMEDNGPQLSQEKSKQGLGEVYAEEYARKFLTTDETKDLKTKEIQEEVINLFNHLSRQLNELSHFYFTPKPIVEETSAKVLATQRSLPAVDMEDITPFHVTSDGNQAAPEEVLTKQRGRNITLLAPEEMTSADRKKLRKYYKEKNKATKAAKAAEERLLHPDKPISEKNLVRELKGDKRVTLAKDRHEKSGEMGGDNTSSKGNFSNSSSFFNFLQKETENAIHGKRKQSSHDNATDSKRQKKVSSHSANFKL